MTNSTMVKRNDGYYELIGAATVEDWADVREAAESVELIEYLTGWGEYTAAYKVCIGGDELTYMVNGSKNSAMMYRAEIEVTDHNEAGHVTGFNAKIFRNPNPTTPAEMRRYELGGSLVCGLIESAHCPGATQDELDAINHALSLMADNDRISHYENA